MRVQVAQNAPSSMLMWQQENTDVITILELVGYVTRRRENVTISRRHRHDHHQPPLSCAPHQRYFCVAEISSCLKLRRRDGYIRPMAEKWFCERFLVRSRGFKATSHGSLDRFRFQESVETNGIKIGAVQQKLLTCFLDKNKLKLSDQCQGKGETVNLNKSFQSGNFTLTLSVIISNKRIVIPSYFLRVKLVFVRGVGAVDVCDQSGDEANLINQMVSDRSKTGGYGYRTSRATF
ncbi:LOW QUALITY PROTEIN: hypothetical protein YC2023_044909 [Brassica napus]